MAIGLDNDHLVFHFPEVHRDAVLRIGFERTLRVPDDGNRYGLPPGLGEFPLRAVDELPTRSTPPDWRARGGVALPMWQSEACWLNFDSTYPFLVKVAAGMVNAVTGGPWSNEPDFEAEDYFEVPSQPWLDGFCVAEGVVRQFVAMPLGAGYTVEEQVTGEAEFGGIQIAVYPMRREVWDARPQRGPVLMDVCGAPPDSSMGLGAGGAITQSIETPVEPHDAWDLGHRSRAFVHLANSAIWEHVTGEVPPTLPPSAADYTREGYPWFEWYGEGLARQGSRALAGVKSVAKVGAERGAHPLPENESFEPPEPIRLGYVPPVPDLEGRGW